ncbi:DUF5010 domain-containing protein [Paludisphaera mucosa]|uniref:DUF5010 domain-containing protein n=1 Tax=Paludisphaera mucosa TaxID=3030827 RepID=A0ABT6FJX0_9BACT|nr:DUF5010 domain-containing protein [Paludisphaera mucosa]MDG3007675.1 DUF5010 domain-containing protein [Paludisphaera mucosa]
MRTSTLIRSFARATAAAASLLTLAAAVPAPAQEPVRKIPPAIGPNIDLEPGDFARSRRFGPGDKVVMTHYFYWYDAPSKAHIVDYDGSDALTTHPPTLRDFSYKSVSWHKGQLKDMIAAGIDVVLPVFWGSPGDHTPGSRMFWSFEGLPPFVKALDELKAEGIEPPAVGLFYDTSTLESNGWGYHADLTTDLGRAWFVATIRDFFSMIPPRHWALLDGKPIVDLYSAAFAKAHDQSSIDLLKAEFPKRFGGTAPYVIREVSWNVKADDVYAWGGAVRPNFLGVAEIGPGYDHSAVPGREPLVVDREGGAFYERAWVQALNRSPRIVIVETWNEFHEGTTVAEAREYGRTYIDLTRKYVDMFKKGIVPPRPRTAYTDAATVAIALGATDRAEGLARVDVADGRSAAATTAGKTSRAPAKGVGGRYLYFRVDDGFKWARSMHAAVEVDYYDAGPGSFGLQYDSHDPSAELNGAYKPAAARAGLTGSHAWKTVRFDLPDARLDGAQNGGADFRLAF